MNKEREVFAQQWNITSALVSQIAESKGWTIESDIKSQAEKIALIHSELSEALEAMRHNNPPSNHIPEFSGVEEEFADVVIRIMHLAYRMNYRIPEAIFAKTDFNATREYKHGGKLI